MKPEPGSFLVLREDQDCKYFVHASEEEAVAEAERLAGKEGRAFVILTPVIHVAPKVQPAVVTDLRVSRG